MKDDLLCDSNYRAMWKRIKLWKEQKEQWPLGINGG